MPHLNNHLISIVLPCYNGENHLASAIESCLNQSYKNFELIIVNDCSTDETLNIANQFSKQDDRVTVLNNETNKKLPASLNIGHREAKGDFITWTSDDNILKSNFLESLIKTLLANKVDIVYSDYEVINEGGDLKRVHKTGPTEHILFGNKIGASFMYKKEVFKALKGFDESLFLLEDYDFWLRASAKFKVHHIDDNLYQYRLHADSLTSDIHSKSQVSIKYKEGVLRMFKKLADEFSWKPETLNLLIENLLNQPINISNYLKDKKIIQKDLLKFNSNEFDSHNVIFGLQLLLRNQLITNNGNHNFKTLINVLKNEIPLLFQPSFSKKTTYTYILKSLFK